MRISGDLLPFSMAAACAAPAFAQAPPPAEPKVWTVAAGAGLALTSGNTDTTNVNASYDLVYDPQAGNIVKSDALLIRGKTDGEVTADRVGLNVRDQYTLTQRLYVFGQNQYLRDRFKSIDYLLAPSFGAGYKLLDMARTKLDVDAGLGGVWEKNPGLDVRRSGAVTFGEKLTQALTATSSLTQGISALWKTSDVGDSLYVFNVGAAAAMSTRTQLKVELLDTYKNQPPLAAIDKNDVAVLVTLVYKQ